MCGQNVNTDSLNYAKGVSNALEMYRKFIDPSTVLYNGIEYNDYAYTLEKGSPYFMDTDFKTGSLFYDGVLFENIQLMYDLVKGQVLINEPFKIYKLSLINERVSWFSVLDHKFVRLVANDSDQSVITTGFYDLLYEADVSLYKKEKKKVNEEITFPEGIHRSIIRSESYFLRKDGTLYSFSNKNSLLSLLKDKRKEIQQFSRKNKLDLRKDRENAFTRIVAYYNSIK